MNDIHLGMLDNLTSRRRRSMDEFVEQVLENWNKAFLTNSSRFSSVNQRFLYKIVSSPLIKVQNSKDKILCRQQMAMV